MLTLCCAVILLKLLQRIKNAVSSHFRVHGFLNAARTYLTCWTVPVFMLTVDRAVVCHEFLLAIETTVSRHTRDVRIHGSKSWC